jgi:hypothetical protein
MTPKGWTILALVVLPVVATLSIGVLARAFVDGGRNHWPVWLVVLALSCAAWLYVFSTEVP